jgi:hypothetical protein
MGNLGALPDDLVVVVYFFYSVRRRNPAKADIR